MKKFVSLIFASCLLGLLLTGCKKEEPHECITKYIFQNDTELPVTITCYRYMDPAIQETTTILIDPGKKWVELYETTGFKIPFFEYYKIVIDNTKVNMEYFDIPTGDNLYNSDNPDLYTMILDEQYERHYLFVFTDEFFTEIE